MDDTAVGVLGDCARLAPTADPELEPLAAQLDLALGRIGTPMRVAVSGQIKRGKSTLVNALLGREVAPTAHLEATFTVSEFLRADQAGVLVHYIDRDRPPLPVPVEEFRSYTVSEPAHARALHGVRRVEYGLPLELLETFRLVDTPGLGSVHGVDSGNTVDFLGIGGFLGPGEEEALLTTLKAVGRTAADIHRDSADELERADAVVYLFDRAVNERDLVAVADFLGPLGPLGSSVTALKAFGVLSRCDETYWPPGPDQPGNPDPLTWDPLEVAARIVEGYRSRPRTRRLFYTVLPVAGLVAVGAQTLSEEQFGWLYELSALEPRRLASLLSDAGRFATRPTLSGVALDVAQRATLVRRLGAWGCLRAATYLRDGLCIGDVRAQLVMDSGVARLRDTIRNHFGNRSELLKLDHGLSDVAATIARIRLDAQRAARRPPPVVEVIAGRIQDLRRSEHGFAELDVLSAYYNGELELTATETEELLRVTGEYGVTVADRLGMPADATAAELEAAARARVAAWSARVLDPTLGRRTATAARRILRSYDRLTAQVARPRALADPGAGR